MGMFNYVHCRYLLPDAEAQDLEFQTKSLPEQALDNYEVTLDGQLLYESYNVEVEENPKAPFRFRFHRVNREWEAFAFTGELEIHNSHKAPDGILRWYSYLLSFENGRVTDLQHGTSHGEILPSQPSSIANERHH